MAEVFVCPKGQLTAASRRELRRAGVVVVEVDEPERCNFVRSSETVSADDILWAALGALRHKGDHANQGVQQRERLALNLWEIVNAARLRPPGSPEPAQTEGGQHG